MTDLSRFEDLGMDIIGSKYSRFGEGVTLKLDHDAKKAYFSMSETDAEIIFKMRPYKVKFVLDRKVDRLYIVEVDADLLDAVTLSTNAKDKRARCRISGLYDILVKYNYNGLTNSNIKYNNDLNAYYVEVK